MNLVRDSWWKRSVELRFVNCHWQFVDDHLLLYKTWKKYRDFKVTLFQIHSHTSRIFSGKSGCKFDRLGLLSPQAQFFELNCWTQKRASNLAGTVFKFWIKFIVKSAKLEDSILNMIAMKKEEIFLAFFVCFFAMLDNCQMKTEARQITRRAIVNGHDSPDRAFYVKVQTVWYNRTAEEELFGFCGGTIIDRHFVLSAAHCFIPGEKTKITIFSTLKLRKWKNMM